LARSDKDEETAEGAGWRLGWRLGRVEIAEIEMEIEMDRVDWSLALSGEKRRRKGTSGK